MTGYKIETESSNVTAGDAVVLDVVEQLSDGTTQQLSSDLTVAWSLPTTATASSPTANNPPDVLPGAGANATATFFSNPGRTDITDDISNVVFVLDAGTSNHELDVMATLTPGNTIVTAELEVAPALVGDVTRGQTTYTANCASCHGATGDGTPENSGGTYTIDGVNYSYPAPGLNNAPSSGNLGGDPTWNAALLAFAARADGDNNGVELRVPMPNWLGDRDTVTEQLLTTQDFADIYAYLVSETQ